MPYRNRIKGLMTSPFALTAYAAILLAVVFAVYFEDQRQVVMDNLAKNEQRINAVAGNLSVEFLERSAHQINYFENLLRLHLKSKRQTLSLRQFEPHLVHLVRDHVHFFQLRLIDRHGNELIKLTRDRNSGRITVQRNAGNVAHRYYFTKMIDNPGKLYLSNLDLNFEYNALEKPIRPVLRIGKKIPGLPYAIVGNIEAQVLLTRMARAATTDGADFYLFNAQGNQLTGPNRELNWDFKTNNLRRQFPEIWQSIRKQASGQVIRESSVLSFTKLDLAPPEYLPAEDSPMVAVTAQRSELASPLASEAGQRAVVVYLVLVMLVALLIFQFKQQQVRVESELRKKTRIVDAMSDVQANYIREVDVQELLTGALKHIVGITDSQYGVVVRNTGVGNSAFDCDAHGIIRVQRDRASSELVVGPPPGETAVAELRQLAADIVASGVSVQQTTSGSYGSVGSILEPSGIHDGGQILENLLGLPVRYNEKPLAVIAVADSASNFAPGMVRNLTVLVEALGSMLNGYDIISDRSRAMKSLAESEARMRNLLAASPDAMLVVDAQGTITDANPAAVKLFGYDKSELVGLTVETLVPASVRHRHTRHRQSYLRQPKNRRMGRTPLLSARRADGSEVKVDISLGYSEVEGEKVIITTIRDMTEKYDLDEQLRQAYKMEAIGQLTGGIAHDFNNLLGVVMGNLELSLQQEGLSEMTRACLNRSFAATQRGADLTRRLLAFSRKQSLEPAYLDPAQVVEGMGDLLRHTLGTDIAIDFAFSEDSDSIYADRGQLENCILNLAINARDAMPGGGRLQIETATMEVGEADRDFDGPVEPGRFVVISVSDNGCGMNQEVRQHLFEPFYTTKEIGKGSGLGLSMVFGFIKQSGGYVRAYSEEGVGTTIKLLLRAHEQSAPLTEAPDPAVIDTRQLSGRMLVVDDDPDLLNVAARMVKSQGIEVVTANGSNEAMEILAKDRNFNFLFTDVVMPGSMNGIQLGDYAKSVINDIRVIITSGFPKEILELKGDINPEFVQLRKPYTRMQLNEAICKAVTPD